MARIGFLAFLGTNYGSVLQSLALDRAIRALGHDSELIHYHRHTGPGFVNPFGWNEDRLRRLRNLGRGTPLEYVLNPARLPESLKRLLFTGNRARYLSTGVDIALMRTTFRDFILANFNKSSVLRKLPGNMRLAPKQWSAYDAYVVGSDQIWTPGIFWFTPDSYLAFAPPGKRIAYAASANLLDDVDGFAKVRRRDWHNLPQARAWIRAIDHVSVREASFARIVSALTRRPAATVLDPTFLLTPEQWDKAALTEPRIAKPALDVMKSGRPYLLAYFLDVHTRPGVMDRIKRFARRRGWDVVWMLGRDKLNRRLVNMPETCPIGLFHLLRNAAFVCCDGFHGSCLSINLRKPFLYFKNALSGHSRLVDLFSRLGIDGRVVERGGDPELNGSETDFSRTGALLEAERATSLDFLSNALTAAASVQVPPDSFPPPDKPPHPAPPPQLRPRVPLADADACTGCGACRNVCPVDAVAMAADATGFPAPAVDEERCIGCGKCLATCPVHNRPAIERPEPEAFVAGWAKGARAASGGLFAALARGVVADGGVVFGSAFDARLGVAVRSAATVDAIAPLCGVKRVQSDVGTSFRKVRALLDKGRRVLYAGTACQISGLLAFLGRDCETLLTVDVACDGVPSPGIWAKYVGWLRERHGGRVTDHRFSPSWRTGGGFDPEAKLSYRVNGRACVRAAADDPYAIMCGKHYLQRRSCFACPERGTQNRVADITLGVFADRKNGGPPDKHGETLVSANTAKGRAAFAELRRKAGEALRCRPCAPEAAEAGCAALARDPKRVDEIADEMLDAFGRHPFESAVTEFFGDETMRATERKFNRPAPDARLRVLFYNWVDYFDTQGGGVTVYLRNILTSRWKELFDATFLSSGFSFDLFNKKPFLRRLNADTAGTDEPPRHELVNSPVIAPARHESPETPRGDQLRATTSALLDFIAKNGPFDIVHFHNLEGFPVDALAAIRQRFPDIKFVFSAHNYYPLCHQVNFWNAPGQTNCVDFLNGKRCVKCLARTNPAKVRRLRQQRELRERKGLASGWRRTLLFNRVAWGALRRMTGQVTRRLPFFRKKTEPKAKPGAGVSGPLLQKRRDKFINLLNKEFARILCVSRRVRDIYARYGVDGGKLAVDYIGTRQADGFERYPDRRGPIAPADAPFTLSYLGYVRTDKGFFFLLDALERMPADQAAGMGVRLAAKFPSRKVGESVLARLEKLKGKFRSLEHFDGYSHDDLDRLLADTTLGVIPSLWEDNLPQVSIEMHCRRVPFLTSDLGGASELANHPGFVFRHGDVDHFLEQLARIRNGAFTHEEYWANAMRPVTMAEHMDRLARLYREILSESGREPSTPAAPVSPEPANNEQG